MQVSETRLLTLGNNGGGQPVVKLPAVGGAGAGEGRTKLSVGVVGARDVVVGVAEAERATVVDVGAALATAHSATTRHAVRNDLLDFFRAMGGMVMRCEAVSEKDVE